MATCTISLTQEAYRCLARLKKKGQSFSDVVVEYLRPKPETAGELLEELERNFEGVPITTLERLQKIREGRGRRSKRRR